MLGSVKTAVGRISPLAILGSKRRFLRLRAADQDQLGGDLRARAERADADVAARQLLGDDAHRHLAEPEAAVFLGDGEAEDAELGEAADDLERDIGVGAVPVLRMGDRLRRRRSGASRRGSPRTSRQGRDRRSPPRAPRRSAPPAAPALRGALPSAISVSTASVRAAAISGLGEAEIGEADDLALVHRRCRRRSGRDIRRGRSGSAAPRSRRSAPRPACARHSRPSRGSPRHRSRARRARARHAARARVFPRSRAPPSLTRGRTAAAARASRSSTARRAWRGEVVERHGLLPQAECCIAQCVGA